MKCDLQLPPESLALARRTLLNSTLSIEDATLIETDVENVGGQELIYFDFKGGSNTVSRVYADPE